MARANEVTNPMIDPSGEHENSSLEEWTIIDDKETNHIRVKNHEGNNLSVDNDCPAAEQAREVIN